jgi:hypothetical protein
VGLIHKSIQPPYVPVVSSDPFDMSSFDPELDPKDSGPRLLAEEPPPQMSEANQQAFLNF